ncbi:hypothetical protein K2173_022793 [Erythroxylum novogranatense]|uniref:Large ribosomal subunit protein uL29c n=1 Tax=Erythroxylum novogranatense TaxID=1862640 RepID=A0AAV8SMS0_9ROSI|nr:hypothetical protein K2173_022793 [Erythroxylum novogranatense]
MFNLSTLTLPPKPALQIPNSSFSGIQIRHKCHLPACQPMKPRFSSSKTPSSYVIMMAKREELKEIRFKTTKEINEEVVNLKGELFMLRLQKSARNEFKSSEFCRIRKRRKKRKRCCNKIVIYVCDGNLSIRKS